VLPVLERTVLAEEDDGCRRGACSSCLNDSDDDAGSGDNHHGQVQSGQGAERTEHASSMRSIRALMRFAHAPNCRLLMLHRLPIMAPKHGCCCCAATARHWGLGIRQTQLQSRERV